ncbi:amidase [Jeotgalibacillus proteolyticus]|uniref:Amidase n=1 Tax=Jeotgalibacillus proteolyticus TaxID=2082395 RepID=A0A2S5G8R0_9BACL|nr:amidase [Jeotgalibacillus proteolyticus]PPA69301.1 amidase [Jeotgalibacillus proteolyticus]
MDKASTLNSSFIKATWIWNPTAIIQKEHELLSFINKKQLVNIWLQIDQTLPHELYQQFIKKAGQIGTAVYALDGAEDWIESKELLQQNRLMAWLRDYQVKSDKPEWFAGVHLDVEPYLTEGWTEDHSKAIHSYQTLLTKAKKDTESMNLVLEADIPFWFDEIFYENHFGRGNLAEWVIANTDRVTIMAYRNQASAIIEIVKNKITFAGNWQKQLIIGVETDYTNEGDHVSFINKRETDMNHELSLVANYFCRQPGFGGLAIHHLDSWKSIGY